MRLVNRTDISNDLIREIVRTVKPASVTNFKLIVRNRSGSRSGHVRTYDMWDGDRVISGRIVASVGSEEMFGKIHRRHRNRDRFNRRLTELRSRIDSLVFVIAHELRHQWQRDHRRGRVWGSRGKYSERDADAYATRKLREWRRRPVVVDFDWNVVLPVGIEPGPLLYQSSAPPLGHGPFLKTI